MPLRNLSIFLLLLLPLNALSSSCTDCTNNPSSGGWCGDASRAGCTTSQSSCTSSCWVPTYYSSSYYSNTCSSLPSYCTTSASSGRFSPLPEALPSDCANCISTSFSASGGWCGDAPSAGCFAQSSSCSSSCWVSAYSSYYSCSSLPSYCSTSTLVNTVAASNLASAARTSVIAGVTVSVLLGLLFAGLPFVFSGSAPPSPRMEAWRPRARKAWPLLAAGNGCLSFGVVTGIAAPAIPWYIGSSDTWTGLQISTLCSSSFVYYRGLRCNTGVETYTNFYMIGGSVGFYLGLLLCTVAWILALRAGARVRGVAQRGGAPSVGSCCETSLPAVQGCIWTGTLFCWGSAAANWTVNSFLVRFP